MSVSIDLRLGDCLDVLRDLPDGCVDAVVTDPPYGVGLGSRINNGRARAGYASTPDEPISVEWARRIVAEFVRIGKRAVVFCGRKSMFKYPEPTSVLCVYQPAGAGCNSWGFTCWQPVLVYGKDPYGARYPDSVKWTGASEDIDHPCPKPTGLMRWIVERATRNSELVLDPFMGSGTTGVACVETGRNFIGIEIDPEYFAIAERRIAEAQRNYQPQLALV